MKKQNQYEWLIVAEGNSDISVYKKYLSRDNRIPFHIISVGGKGYSLNMNAWETMHIESLLNDIGRIGFKGLILVIDSDTDIVDPFASYRRSDRLIYTSNSTQPPLPDPSGIFWNIDSVQGTVDIPIKGICVPKGNEGCLETDLLKSYGFPTRPQCQYNSLVSIIKTATKKWGVSDNKDGKHWWEVNEEAKMDKFIYNALAQGFKSCNQKPDLPSEPDVIKNIRIAMNATA